MYVSPVQARVKYANWCQQGGQAVRTSGLNSTTFVQRSFKTCTVTVYTAGTTTTVSLFSDNAGTVLANPFTSQNTNTGQYFFYADLGNYDVKIAATDLTTFTIGDIVLGATTIDCAGYLTSSSDVGAKVVACQADLPSGGGILDACRLTGSQTWTTSVDLTLAGSWLRLCSGTFTLGASTTITVSGSRAGIIGAGQQSTIIKFNPSGTASAIIIKGSGGLTNAQSKLSGFALDAASNATQAKTGIEIQDGEEVELSDIAISNWTTTTGHTSVGIRARGRQSLRLSRITASADTPIRISKNSNSGQPDADHYHFEDLYLLANSNPNLQIDDGVNLSDLNLDGYQAYVGGTDGLRYSSTTDTVASLAINLQNIRWEQGTGSTGYGITLSNAQGFYGVNLRNIYIGSVKGFLLKDVVGGLMSGCIYATASEALRTSGDMRMAFIGNSFNTAGGATMSTTGFANSVWIANDANARIGIGQPKPNNQLLIPNNTKLAGENLAGNAEIQIVGINTSNVLEFAPGGQASYFDGPVFVGTGTPPFSAQQILSIANAKYLGGENAASSDSIALIGVDSSNVVQINPGLSGIRMYGAQIADPANTSADTGVLFFRKVAGKMQIAARFPSGAVQVIAAEP